MYSSGKNSIIIIQGAQWGSESKGMVAHAIALQENVKFAVRTGSINAGHSIIMPDGAKFAFQQLPTAAAIPGVVSVIGPGAYINEEILNNEIARSGTSYVMVDNQCGVHLEEYTDEAKAAGRSIKIGATGKGCAESIIHKIKDRNVEGKPPLLYKSMFGKSANDKVLFKDTVNYLTEAYHNNQGKILIEGTQGTLLDFHLGPYPFVTSRQTISSAWVVESGLSPTLNYEVVLVARTYPIRVAGNSGPMPNEINWPQLTRSINRKLARYKYEPIVREEVLQEFEARLKEADEKRTDQTERWLYSNTDAILAMSTGSRTELLKFFETTTVTKRLRRIAALDRMQLKETVRRENPSYMVLTFLNYEFPEVVHTRQLTSEMLKWLEELQKNIKCWIKYVTIGPKPEDMIHTPEYLYGKSLDIQRW